MIQGWTINILVMRSRGRTEKCKNGQKRHRTKAQKIKLKVDKNPQRENILILQHQGARCHDHMIQGWTTNILIMRSRGRTKKSKNGQKCHTKKAPKDKTQSGQKPPKRKYFNTPTIKVSQ